MPYFTVIDEFATIHPESILEVHTHTARYSKCCMFSVCVVIQLSLAPSNSTAPLHRAGLARRRPVIVLRCYVYSKLYGVTLLKSAVITHRPIEYTQSQ
jgi:hypothetical protein